MRAQRRSKMRKKLASLLLAAALLPTLALPALATQEDDIRIPESTASVGSGTTDISYTGSLDPLTGLPSGSTVGDTLYATLREGSYGYDLEQRCYVNEVGGKSFTSSIPNGALLSAGVETVSFSVPVGLSAVLYRNGNAVSDADLSNITEAGSYLLEVGMSNSDESVSFSFRLLDGLTNSLSELSLPDGFRFEYVLLNGETITTDYSNYTQLIADGSYEVCWSCEEIGKRYTVSFTRDTVAPTLALPEVIDGEAHSAVSLTDLEENCYILLTELDSGETQTIVSAETELTQAGRYRLTVYDRAGNSSVYDFVIHVYLNISAVAALVLIAGAVGSLSLYSRYIRKHPRVG